jgi:hypothetical protein
MRHISTSIAFALSTLLFISICSAQQRSTSNNKQTNSGQNASPAGIEGPVIGGDGTAHFIPLWISPNYLLSSVIYQASGGNIGIGTTSPVAKLDVNGAISTNDTNAAAAYQINGTTVLTMGDPLYESNNLFVGIGTAVNNTTGNYNVFVGFSAGYSNTTGSGNTFSGTEAGAINNDSSYNTFTGTEAGGYHSSGDFNTFVGFQAGVYHASGTSNVYIGSGAGQNNTGGNSNIYIANSGCQNPCQESGTMRLGSGQTKTYISGIYGSTSSSGIPVYINSNGQLGTQTSSVRFKEQVRDMGDSTSALMKLRPVTFLYKPEYADGERTLQYGLIAEEVAKVYPELVANDNDGQPYTVRYQYITTMLLNEVQKQYRRAEAEATIITAQEQKIDELEQRLSRLENLIPQTVAQK